MASRTQPRRAPARDSPAAGTSPHCRCKRPCAAIPSLRSSVSAVFPGADEDMQGLPFVGRAGKLLTQMIEAMGLQRKDVYICNVVKCRPPENRAPEPDEVAACSPFLMRQIDSIHPKAIVCLGATAAKTILKPQ